MVKCIYSTEVLLDDPKGKTLVIVLYVTIIIDGVFQCKSPMSFDIFSDSSYDITFNENFKEKWNDSSIQNSQDLVEILMRFYCNVDDYKTKMKKS